MAIFKVSCSIRKELLKKDVNREITFALISLLYVQIQELAGRSTTTRAFVFLAKFIIAKYLKQEVGEDLKLVSAISLEILVFHQMIVLQKP